MLLITIENTQIATLVDDSLLLDGKYKQTSAMLANEGISVIGDEVNGVMLSAIMSVISLYLGGYTTLSHLSDKMSDSERNKTMSECYELVAEWRKTNLSESLIMHRAIKDTTGRTLHMNIRVSKINIYNS